MSERTLTRDKVNYIRACVKAAMDEVDGDKERKFTPVFWVGRRGETAPIPIKLFKSMG